MRAATLLPYELLSLVLDFLPHLSDVSACARVCQYWYSSASYALYTRDVTSTRAALEWALGNDCADTITLLTKYPRGSQLLLHFANFPVIALYAQETLIDLFLKSPIVLDEWKQRSSQGQREGYLNPLVAAAATRNTTLARRILDVEGVHHMAYDKCHFSPLRAACTTSVSQLDRLLLRYANLCEWPGTPWFRRDSRVQDVGKFGRMPFDFGLASTFAEIIVKDIRDGTWGCRPLECAVHESQLEFARFLFSQGATISKFYTPISRIMDVAVMNECAEMVKLLRELGA